MYTIEIIEKKIKDYGLRVDVEGNLERKIHDSKRILLKENAS